MAKRIVIGLLAATLLAGLMGCTRNTSKEEMRKYNMQAYQEGNKEAETQGRGRNGQFLDTMQKIFKDMNIQLTNETFTEDAAGNMSYQYRINNDSSQIITVYIFNDELTRVNGMKHMYGTEGTKNTAKANNMIIGYKDAALVYTSGGTKKDQYTDQVKKVGLEVLKNVPHRSYNKPK